MLRSSLFVPDDVAWRVDPGYSTSVAGALLRAYTHLKQDPRGETDHASRAHAVMLGVVSRPMSERQRLHVLYGLGMACAGEQRYADALDQLDEAITLAAALRDAGATAVCAYLRAQISGALQRCNQAVEYYRLCLDALHDLGGGPEPVDAALELDAQVGLAQHEFMLAQYGPSLARLEEARRLIAYAPESQTQAVAIEWVATLHFRWRGEPERALSHAMAAADALPQRGDSASYGRIQTIVAECALDLAERFPAVEPLHAHHAFVDLADPYVTRALKLARATSDLGGEGLAQLCYARFLRTRQPNADDIPTIQDTLRLAERRDDVALLGQAYTALGDAFAVRSEAESALTCYRAALEVFADSEAPALGVWARRALLRAGEGGVGRTRGMGGDPPSRLE